MQNMQDKHYLIINQEGRREQCEDWVFYHEEAFIQSLLDQHKEGFGLIPLIGSGLSKRSGIITGQEFDDYLLWATYQVFKRKYNLPAEGWPEFPTEDERKEAHGWLINSAKHIATRLESKQDGPWLSPEELLLQEAIGNLAVWRSILFFLSRLRIEGPVEPNRTAADGNSGGRRIVAAAPDYRVIDEFNSKITRGKRPNLGHKMLPLLASPLRIKTILTTNFDTLIEESFAEARLDLEVFDVHTADGLPESRVINSASTLIKLHGSRFQTRADYSLDAEPSDQDKEVFRSYFHPRRRRASQPHSFRTEWGHSHLLVAGYSGSDHRVMSLIKALADTGSSEEACKIYWVCHLERDVDRLAERCKTYGLRNVRAIVARADLLLAKIYGHATMSMAPGGVAHQYSDVVAPYPPSVGLKNDEDRTNTRAAAEVSWRKDAAQIVEAMIDDKKAPPKYFKTKGSNGGRYWLLDGDVHGITVLAAEMASCFSGRGKRCIWFETDDYADEHDLIAEVYRTLAIESGVYHLEHVTLNESIKATDLKDYLGLRPDEWVVFINARTTESGDCGWDQKDRNRTNEWNTYRQYESPSGKPGVQNIHDYLTELGGLKITVVAMPYVSNNKACKPLVDVGASEFLERALKWVSDRSRSGLHFDHNDYPEHLRRHREMVSTSTEDQNQRLYFLYAATLFRHARNNTALWTDCCYSCPAPHNADRRDNDEIRYASVSIWLYELEQLGLIRRKPGGFVWFHRKLREILKADLEAKYPVLWSKRRPRIHFWIADWHLRAFRATGHVHPIIEALYHFRQAYVHASWKIAEGESYDSKNLLRRRELKLISLNRFSRALAMYEDPLKNQLDKEQAMAYFGNGAELEKVSDDGSHPELYEKINIYVDRIASQTRSIYHVIMRRLGEYGEAAKWKDPLQIQVQEDTKLVRNPEVKLAVRMAISRRDYRTVEQEIIALLQEGSGKKLSAIAGTTPEDATEGGKDAYDKMQEGLDEWMSDNVSRFGSTKLSFGLLMRALHFLTRVNLQRGKLKWLGLLRDKEERLIDWNNDRKDLGCGHFLLNCIYARLIMRLGWMLPRDMEDFQILQYIRTEVLYGLSLGYLGRFSEARKRLDNAHAYLANSSIRHDNQEWAIIESRRAEVALLERLHMEFGMGKAGGDGARDPRVTRQKYALMEGALIRLQRAENLMAGASRSVWWWGILYVQKIRILAQVAAEKDGPEWFQSFRGKDLVGEAGSVLRTGKLLRPQDLVRSYQLHYFYHRVLDNRLTHKDSDVRRWVTRNKGLREELGSLRRKLLEPGAGEPGTDECVRIYCNSLDTYIQDFYKRWPDF